MISSSARSSPFVSTISASLSLAGVTGRCQRSADGRAERLTVPERLDHVLRSVAIAVVQQPDATVVADSEEFAVGAVAEVVHVVDLDGQFARAEPWQEHLHGRRIGNRHQGCRAFTHRRAGETVGQSAVFRIEVMLDRLSLGFRQGTIKGEHLRKVSVEETLHMWAVRSVRITSCSKSEIIEPKD